MTASSSIDPSEFLHEHLSQASPDLGVVKSFGPTVFMNYGPSI